MDIISTDLTHISSVILVLICVSVYVFSSVQFYPMCHFVSSQDTGGNSF